MNVRQSIWLQAVAAGERTITSRNCTGLLLAFLLGGLGEQAWAGNASPGSELAACNQQPYQTLLTTKLINDSEASAYWLSGQLIRWPAVKPASSFKLYGSRTGQLVLTNGKKANGFDQVIDLKPINRALPPELAARFAFTGTGKDYEITDANQQQIKTLLQGQVLIAALDADGKVLDFTSLQIAGALDDLYKSASYFDGFGALPQSKPGSNNEQTQFNLWAPTAQKISVCLYAKGSGNAHAILPMQADGNSGIWRANTNQVTGQYYNYLVDVYVQGKGMIRNRVTDPYSVSLTTDSKRSYIADLDSANLKPLGWDRQIVSTKVKHQTDMQVYELHVRDFSINDASVRPAYRGKYLAFTEQNSRGMQHLRALSASGMTDIHLLPVFDFATVPEKNCRTPSPSIKGAADGSQQQKLVMQYADKDCYNWGYEPYHYNAPEGSYATDAEDGARRILELRQMVMALHAADLRVGMDVVYNHTAGAGQTAYSVLDRIVPGYYHRLNAQGQIERSTCCDNTATENSMMAKLMSDSVLSWAKHYKIDSFRFDLMGHQPRQAMEDMQARLQKATSRQIQFIGEGWNFGEIADGKRFVQASQLSLNGSNIGTFSDRARDALRGGGYGDDGDGIVKNQGYINGLGYAPNALADQNKSGDALLRAADLVRMGLAGSLRDFRMQTWEDQQKRLQDIDYNGQIGGYASQPGEVVNYVENHDNQTLFDINAFRLPINTSSADRARIQALALATTAFSQGIAYYHAGVDILRSKSMDGNSFNSGDWFNRLDWRYQDNYFGTGLPPEKDNGKFYALIKPLLNKPGIKPGPQDIAFSRGQFRDLLKIRSSSPLFRMTSAAEIEERLHFYNTGAKQNPLVIVGHLDGKDLPDTKFAAIMYFINVSGEAQKLRIAEQSQHNFVLHPVHLQAQATDKRVAAQATYDSSNGEFSIPALSAVVFVEMQSQVHP